MPARQNSASKHKPTALQRYADRIRDYEPREGWSVGTDDILSGSVTLYQASDCSRNRGTKPHICYSGPISYELHKTRVFIERKDENFYKRHDSIDARPHNFSEPSYSPFDSMEFCALLNTQQRAIQKCPAERLPDLITDLLWAA